jgi:hypothetical protein
MQGDAYAAAREKCRFVQSSKFEHRRARESLPPLQPIQIVVDLYRKKGFLYTSPVI